MNLREHAVLEGLNLAPFHSDRPDTKDFWCTAADVARAIRDDPRFADERAVLGADVTAREVGYVLRGMQARIVLCYLPSLVESRKRGNVKVWRMSDAGARVVIA